MSTLELVIWSLALGAMGMVLLFSVAEWAIARNAAGLQGTVYHALSMLFVALLCGLAGAWRELDREVLRVSQVLIGPACNALGLYWIRGWLGATHRDSLMEGAARLAVWVTPPAALACLALPGAQQLPAAAAICLLNSAVLFWLTARGYLLGDRMALGMATASGFALVAIAGLYAMALGVGRMSAAAQAAIAANAVLSDAVVGVMIWLRSHPHVLTRGLAFSADDHDPVTRLHSGKALVRKLVNAQRRRRRTRRDGAVIAILVFDVDSLTRQVGHGGVQQLFIAIGHRIQRQVGVVNPVGRYWDRCFVSLVETIHSPGWLRTLGLRVAVNLRQPVEVRGLHGDVVELRPDIGVGVVHLVPGNTPVEDVLHDAQRIAEAARDMRSRAATLDPLTGEVVPVEQANLGPRRHGQAGLVPHAVPARP